MPAMGERKNRKDGLAYAEWNGSAWVEHPMTARASAGVRPSKLAPQEEAQLKDARESANMFADVTTQAQTFGKLNEKSGTGPFYSIPGVKPVMSMFDPNIARMQALQARMAPAQRVPGSGTTSDRDLALFLQAIPSVERTGPGNGGIIDDMQGLTKKRQARAYFLDRYAQERGTLKGGEEAFAAEWAKTNPAQQQRAKGGAKPSVKYLGTE